MEEIPRMKKFLSVPALVVLLVFFSFQSAYAMTTVQFYKLALKHRHINPFAVTVQSACETGYWSSDLWEKGYNGAGLKASSEWLNSGKPYITKNSVESRNGIYSKETSKFRKYRSPEEFLRDYARKIRCDYPRCIRNHSNIWGYFAGLYAGRKGKWATDHKYYEKLTVKAIKLAPEIYGYKWKQKLIKDFRTALRRNYIENWQRIIICGEFQKNNVR